MMASGHSWGLPAGQEDLEEIWRAWGEPFSPPLPHFPCAYPALPCCGLLPAPPFGLLAQPVVSSSPCELPGPPPPAPAWPWAPSGAVVVVEEASRAKAAAAAGSRESTAALKAWLGRHRKHPYPSKGEKVLLALVSRMSLTQVSTWFANARRRLKKGARAAGAHHHHHDHHHASPTGHHDHGQPEPGPAPAPPGPQNPRRSPEPDPGPPQAKIWRLAELATGPQP